MRTFAVAALLCCGQAGAEEFFYPGQSCAALAYATSVELEAFLDPELAIDKAMFCYPEEPFECSDYNSFFRNLSRLIPGENDYCAIARLQEIGR